MHSDGVPFVEQVFYQISSPTWAVPFLPATILLIGIFIHSAFGNCRFSFCYRLHHLPQTTYHLPFSTTCLCILQWMQSSGFLLPPGACRLCVLGSPCLMIRHHHRPGHGATVTPTCVQVSWVVCSTMRRGYRHLHITTSAAWFSGLFVHLGAVHWIHHHLGHSSPDTMPPFYTGSFWAITTAILGAVQAGGYHACHFRNSLLPGMEPG